MQICLKHVFLDIHAELEILLFYAKSPKMWSDTWCKNFIPFGWQTKKLAFWGGHFCHFPQNFVSTVRHEFLTKWPQTKPLVVSNMTTITSRICTTIHFKWPALLYPPTMLCSFSRNKFFSLMGKTWDKKLGGIPSKNLRLSEAIAHM